MLRQVLDAIKAAPGPVDLNSLARQLQIERSVLDGMIEFWVRKGKLRDLEQESQDAMACFSSQCGSHCSPSDCPLAGKMPRRFTVPGPERGSNSVIQ